MKIKVLIIFAFIAADILTGYIKAVVTGTRNSTVMRTGLWHKVGELLTVGFGLMVDFALPYVGVEIGVSVFTAMLAYIVIMETTSIVENLSVISPDLADVLGKVFGGVTHKDD